MGRTELARTALTLAAVLLTTGASVQAQFGSLTSPSQTPQAKSQEELDRYLEIVTATKPSEVIRLVSAFVHEFPQSELLSFAYQQEVHAYEQLDDFDGMLAAGRRALAGSPKSLETLLSLSSAIANRAGHRPDRDELLAEAKEYAETVLAEVNRIHISRKNSLEDWHKQKRQMESEAHGALGLVALQKGELANALSELGSSLDLAPDPQGVQFLRLGLAQVAAGRNHDAEENLRRAAERGPDPVRNLALDKLSKMKRSAPLAR
jgi:tetratricopeptide (TPR) repeat protein